MSISQEQVLTVEEVANLSGCDSDTIVRLAELGLLSLESLSLLDINAIRLMLSFETAGVSLSTFAQAVGQGVLSLEFSRHLMPDAIVLSGHKYDELCVNLGLDYETVVRLFVAAGFPVPDRQRLARADEVTFLQLMTEILSHGISEQGLTRILRVFGHSTRRMADSMRDLFKSEVEGPLAAQGHSAAEIMTASAQHRVPLQKAGFLSLRLMSARFLEDAVFENVTMRIQDALTAAGSLARTADAVPAIAFVDLVGYSALTRELGDHEAVLIVAQFEALAQESMAHHNGRIIKALGDGLLLLFREARRAPSGCTDLIKQLAQARMPEVRVGLTAGAVIHRDGDVFGNCVNMAARLAAVAAPSQIVIDAASLTSFDDPFVQWSAGGHVLPKGMSKTEIFTADV